MPIVGSVSIVDLLCCVWNCAVPQVDYIRKLEEKKDALRKKMRELEDLRNDVRRRVDIAEEQQLKSLDRVQGWLSGVRDMEVEVEVLIRDASQEIENKCLRGCCPRNCKASYELGKEVAKKLKEVDDLLHSGGSFVLVAEKQPLPLVVERPSEPTVGLKSTFDTVWSHIKDKPTRIIGLCGLGGVGKTTLLTQINNNFSKEDHNFDVVIWIVVSNNPNFANIQEDIWKRIGNCDSQWKGKTKDEKTLDIFRVLSQKKFVLLLDDIWARIKLSELGVPHVDEKNESKVVFTTRCEGVCGEMGVDELITMSSLAWEDAWVLFREKVGEDTIKSHPKIRELAERVAKECAGLPLALIVIGEAMARKRNLQEWQDAVTTLQKSAEKFSGMEDKVYPCLKFSYDNLSDDTLRSCFLYCSLFPEDFSISNETLVEYWIGEGFFNEIDDLNEAQNKGQVIIGTLIRACLLEEDSSSSIKMLDVIRDMALWIAGKCGEVKKKVLVQAGVNLRQAPKVEKWEGVEWVSLMHNAIDKLTVAPICPDLSILFLNSNKLKEISGRFFQNMPNLRVLDLSWNQNLAKLPEEISELVFLQYLNLSGTEIVELPIKYKKLVKLKYLNFEETYKLNVIPAGLLSSFEKLQVLKMSRSLIQSVKAKDYEFETLECLKELIELTITIYTTSALSRFLSCPELPTFTTKLYLILLEGPEDVDICGSQGMRCLREFSMDSCYHFKYLKAERANFQSLRKVKFTGCISLKELTFLIYAPNLEILSIKLCAEMEEVIRSEPTREGGYLNPFAELKQLELDSLPQLKSIYPNALLFPRLNFIDVKECPNLKKLPLDSGSAKGCGLVIKGHEDWWKDLVWEGDAAQYFLHSFRSMGF